MNTSNTQEKLSFEKVWALFQENREQMKETDLRMKETDRKLNKLESLFTSQWGKLVESLVEGDSIRLLNQKGIPVHQTQQRIKGCCQGKNFEFDIIAINGKEVVIIEVKTTLRPKDIKEFKEKLRQAKTWMPAYANCTIYGAIAYLRADAAAESQAENIGLFVIKATGSSASITNAADFIPTKF